MLAESGEYVKGGWGFDGEYSGLNGSGDTLSPGCAFPVKWIPADQRCDADLIGIGAAVTRRPLPHHRTYGSVYGGSRWLRLHFLEQ
jgi:hypothetical protein